MRMMASPDEEAAGAARAGADLDRPIAGEDPASDSLDEAERWIGIYHHLLSLEQDLFDRLAMHLTSMPPAAQREAESTNLPVLMTTLERFRHRLAFWQKRRDELEGRRQQ